VNISDRVHNVVNILSETLFWKNIIGLLQRMTDTGDKSYAELEDIKTLLEKTVEQNEKIIAALTLGRWKQ
tara:strand:+ start:117 stop:326 length:210 start_codon:yes stop_codon:yes gene_type:complete